jgi:hypothetical protein
MELRKASKEIIDREYEKIMAIMEHLKDAGQHCDLKIALAIYSKRHADMSLIEDEDD